MICACANSPSRSGGWTRANVPGPFGRRPDLRSCLPVGDGDRPWDRRPGGVRPRRRTVTRASPDNTTSAGQQTQRRLRGAPRCAHMRRRGVAGAAGLDWIQRLPPAARHHPSALIGCRRSRRRPVCLRHLRWAIAEGQELTSSYWEWRDLPDTDDPLWGQTWDVFLLRDKIDQLTELVDNYIEQHGDLETGSGEATDDVGNASLAAEFGSLSPAAQWSTPRSLRRAHCSFRVC